MNTNLAIQLSENAFTMLSEQAAAVGKTPAELAAAVVESNFAHDQAKSRNAATAGAEFERCFGSVDLGRPIGIANAAIDDDLVREFGAAPQVHMMLLDTSGLLALLDAREPLHQKARDEYARATTRITHSFVLAELVALGNARGVPARPMLQFLMSLLANPDIEVVYPGESLTSQALAFLVARQGRGYSLCDAVSFALMRSNNLSEALSTDQHFDDEGFRRLLA